MGKFVKKGKITGDVAVMEVPQSVLGVRTRARTLALQQDSEFRYLQLRNRRLEKPQFSPTSPPRKPEKQEKSNHGSKQSNRTCSNQIQGGRPAGSWLRSESANSVPTEPASFSRSKAGDLELEFKAEELNGLGEDASFGENNLELDGRSTRESTPCSLIRNVGSMGTPGSAVRSTFSSAVNQRRVHEPAQRSMPSTLEMDEFFSSAGSQQQEQFLDKYNFDISNDSPLPGRFEWVRVDP